MGVLGVARGGDVEARPSGFAFAFVGAFGLALVCGDAAGADEVARVAGGALVAG